MKKDNNFVGFGSALLTSSNGSIIRNLHYVVAIIKDLLFIVNLEYGGNSSLSLNKICSKKEDIKTLIKPCAVFAAFDTLGRYTKHPVDESHDHLRLSGEYLEHFNQEFLKYSDEKVNKFLFHNEANESFAEIKDIQDINFFLCNHINFTLIISKDKLVRKQYKPVNTENIKTIKEIDFVLRSKFFN